MTKTITEIARLGTTPRLISSSSTSTHWATASAPDRPSTTHTPTELSTELLLLLLAAVLLSYTLDGARKALDDFGEDQHLRRLLLDLRFSPFV